MAMFIKYFYNICTQLFYKKINGNVYNKTIKEIITYYLSIQNIAN